MIKKAILFNLLIFCILFLFSKSNIVFAYDYSSTKSVPIKLSIMQEISTKNPLKEGAKLDFRVIDNVFYDGKLIIPKNTNATAILETIITSGMNGFPAEIIIGNFEILPCKKVENPKNLPRFSTLSSSVYNAEEIKIKNTQLIDTITKKGQNRALWVYPFKWALTPIPFVGSLTNFIKGGHAKITPDDVLVIYYYPEWE